MTTRIQIERTVQVRIWLETIYDNPEIWPAVPIVVHLGGTITKTDVESTIDYLRAYAQRHQLIEGDGIEVLEDGPAT